MQLSFRQGIIRYQTPLSGPTLLQPTPLNPTSVDLLVVPGFPVLVTFAHLTANYIISENNTVTGAWGSGTVGSTNGPLPMNLTEYLYWDIDLGSGALTRGWTLLAPIYSINPPPHPQNGQMWFDLVNTVWNVWQQLGTNPGIWLNKVRCFAGTYFSNGVLVPMPLGSQVPPPPGIVGNFAAGNIILGTNNRPLKNSDGTFVNTSTSLIVQETSGQNVSLDAVLAFGEATENIPAFYLVSFSANQTISLADSNGYTFATFANGIVTSPLFSSQAGRVVLNGVITNDTWNWAPSLANAPLFLGPQGVLSLTPPATGVIQVVGYVYAPNAIVLNIGPAIRIRP